MKSKKILVIMAVLLLALLLSGCSASAMRTNSWSGLSADAEHAYLANGSLVYAVNLNNGSLSWQYPAEKADAKEAYFATPVLTDDGQLIIASAGANHSFTSLDPANGTMNWTFGDAEGAWIASPIVVDETIYAPNTDGKLYIFTLAGEFLKARAIGGALWAQPVSDGKFLYITSLDHHIYAFDLAKEEVAWSIELCGATPGSAALDKNGNLYIGSFGATIASLSIKKQDANWKTPIDGWVWDAPVLDGETLYAGDLEGNLHALNTNDGSEVFAPIKPNGPITGSPLVLDDTIIFGTESGTVYAIDREGAIIWKENVGGQLYTAPIQGGNLILVSPTESDFTLIALDPTNKGDQLWQFPPQE